MNAAILLVAVLASAARDQAAQTSPIGKVVQLLSNLEAKIIREGEEAQKIHSKFSEWCEDRSRNIGFEIKTGKGEVADLKATIAEQGALIMSFSTKIEELAAGIASDEADLKAASEIRAKEAADFAAEAKELTETIGTIDRAVVIISREMQKGGASMLQLRNAKSFSDALSALVDASELNSADASRLTALVQDSQRTDDSDVGEPAAAVYESHGADIVDTLQGLQDKAEGQLSDARKKETAAAHNFDMLKQSLVDSIKFSNKDLAGAKGSRAKSGVQKSAAEGDLGMTAKELEANIKQLGDLHRDCMTKAEDFEAETKSRGEELKSLAEAKRVIKEATGGAEQIAYGLDQWSFLQRSRISSSADLARFEVVRFVRDLARKQNLPQLFQLATRMASVMQSGSGDPFAKVKGLIADMIARLEDAASGDATEKAYCDKELSETEAKKADKTAEISKLSTSIDQMTAHSLQLKAQVAGLQKALADVASSSAEMNSMRQEEHTAYVSNKAEMEQGLEGVRTALSILRDYYASKDQAHAAAEGAGSGIIGLLEVCEADFSKDLAEIISAEDTAQTSYDRATKENEIETAVKDQDVKYKTKESVALDKAVAEAGSDRTGVQEQLDAVHEYLANLKARCVAKAETYAERAARREAEVAGLKQALEILENQAALIQTDSLKRVQSHSQEQ